PKISAQRPSTVSDIENIQLNKNRLANLRPRLWEGEALFSPPCPAPASVLPWLHPCAYLSFAAPCPKYRRAGFSCIVLRAGRNSPPAVKAAMPSPRALLSGRSADPV